jgi:hypothetical protein
MAFGGCSKNRDLKLDPLKRGRDLNRGMAWQIDLPPRNLLR